MEVSSPQTNKTFLHLNDLSAVLRLGIAAQTLLIQHDEVWSPFEDGKEALRLLLETSDVHSRSQRFHRAQFCWHPIVCWIRCDQVGKATGCSPHGKLENFVCVYPTAVYGCQASSFKPFAICWRKGPVREGVQDDCSARQPFHSVNNPNEVVTLKLQSRAFLGVTLLCMIDADGYVFTVHSSAPLNETWDRP